MPPRTPLGPRNANARVQKQSKVRGVELSPHKRSVIEGLHKAGCSIKSISEVEATPRATVWNTIKNLNVRPKGHSLPRSGRPPTLSKVEKRSIIRFCCRKPKATYSEVKQELQLNCSLQTIGHIVRKQGIKKWLVKKRPLLTEEVARECLAWCRKRRE
jgi:transposase